MKSTVVDVISAALLCTFYTREKEVLGLSDLFVLRSFFALRVSSLWRSRRDLLPTGYPYKQLDVSLCLLPIQPCFRFLVFAIQNTLFYDITPRLSSRPSVNSYPQRLRLFRFSPSGTFSCFFLLSFDRNDLRLYFSEWSSFPLLSGVDRLV